MAIHGFIIGHEVSNRHELSYKLIKKIWRCRGMCCPKRVVVVALKVCAWSKRLSNRPIGLGPNIYLNPVVYACVCMSCACVFATTHFYVPVSCVCFCVCVFWNSPYRVTHRTMCLGIEPATFLAVGRCSTIWATIPSWERWYYILE